MKEASPLYRARIFAISKYREIDSSPKATERSDRGPAGASRVLLEGLPRARRLLLATEANVKNAEMQSIDASQLRLQEGVFSNLSFAPRSPPESLGEICISIEALPEEILCKIFLFLVQIDAPPPYDLVTATHVCRHWREVALRYPILWSHLDCSDVNATTRPCRLKAFVERSQCCPINVYCSSLVSWHLAPLKPVLEHCHRWRGVYHLNLSDLFLLAWQRCGYSRISLPLLESLTMSLDATSGLDLITDPYLPALKTLKCYHYPNWPVFKTWLKPTLTELEIDGYDSFLSLTIDDWVGALRPLSSLRKLSLVNTFDSLQADSSTHYSTEPIYLPHLKTLSVVVASRSAFDACSHLRDLIRSPWCTEVDVRISGKYRGDGSPAIEARTDSQFLASMAQNTAKALRRAEEAQSVLSMVFEWASYHLSMTVQEVGGDAERKLLEVHLYLPNHVLPYCRPDLEALVAHTVAACPALCGAAILVLLNLGVERRTWDGISVASVPRLLICRESLPAFLDAMEDDPATFMQQLEIMNLFNFDTRFRAPPQPTDEEWQEQRLLSQRVADVLDQRWKLGLGPYSVDLGERWGSIEI